MSLRLAVEVRLCCRRSWLVCFPLAYVSEVVQNQKIPALEPCVEFDSCGVASHKCARPCCKRGEGGLDFVIRTLARAQKRLFCETEESGLVEVASGRHPAGLVLWHFVENGGAGDDCRVDVLKASMHN